jgi:hypothetical protein
MTPTMFAVIALICTGVLVCVLFVCAFGIADELRHVCEAIRSQPRVQIELLEPTEPREPWQGDES